MKMKLAIRLALPLLSLPLFLSHGYAQEVPAAAESGNDSTIVYPASFFAEYGSLTVDDMLDRVPGIDSILQGGGGNSSDGNRGLGSTSQILIDGKRMAGKANEARSQLARIPADQVNRIEIIRGSSSDLDVQNSGQIVNIVLLESLSRSSVTTEVNATQYGDGTLEPGGSLSWSGQSGRLNYTLSGAVSSAYEHLESLETSINGDFSMNETIELDRYREQTNYSLNGNLTFSMTDQDRLAVNFLYEDQDPPVDLYRRVTDFNGPAPVVSFEREAIPATSTRWEIGGDFEHVFQGGSRLKSLLIVNERENNTTRERFVSQTQDGPETKVLFLDTSSLYQEKISRSSYIMNLNEQQGLELGIEIAQTTQESGLRQGIRTAGPGDPAYGGLTGLKLPNAFSTVEEIRFEPFVVHNWQINPRMSLESSLVAEYSEIEQSGDVSLKRDFNYVKPRFDFRFDMSSSLQFRATLEQFVSQLSFADFSRSTNERDDDQDTVAGNPTLSPEESVRAEIGVDFRLPNDGGAINTRYFYYLYDNKIGKIDISTSPDNLQSTNGNVGKAAAYGLITNASIRLGFLGLPQALLTGALTVQESEYEKNPFAPVEIGFPPFDRGSYRLGFRHDIPQQNLSYGVNFNARFNPGRYVYENDNRYSWIIPSNLSMFVEKLGFAGLTYRFEASNLEDFEACANRRRYDGYVRDGILREIEYICSVTGTTYALKVRGTF